MTFTENLAFGANLLYLLWLSYSRNEHNDTTVDGFDRYEHR